MSSRPSHIQSPISVAEPGCAKIGAIPAKGDFSTQPASDFTANAQLAYLEAKVGEWQSPETSRRVEQNPPGEQIDEPASPAALTPHRTLRPATAVKSLVAIAVAVALGWAPVQRLLATTSAEAVVNARIVTLRAPIEGEVTMALPETDIGSAYRVDEPILTIRNPRADSSPLTGLMREHDQLGTSIGALEAKKQLLTANVLELNEQQERFRVGRIAQIEQRTREADADIASAEAQYSVTTEALKRASHLRTTDAVSQAFLDKAQGDARVAEQAVRAQNERKKGMLVELDAARKGTFVGDSYNDTPQSAQRKMEISLELADVDARLAGSRTQLAALDTAIRDEKSRQNRISLAEIHSTVNGRVWEMLTAPGEHVNAGQDLVKLLDCGSAIVTASVSQTAYERLAVGQPATFKPRDGGPELKGTVVALNGLAAVDSNTAIQQHALSREPYHVSLKFPELSTTFDCRVGRSGLVEFDTTAPVLKTSAF